MNQDFILQQLTDSFEVLKDSWDEKSEAIINCIVETEIYDGSLAMEMWLYILNNNKTKLSDRETAKRLVYDVLERFKGKYEQYGNDEYCCRAIIIHVATHIVHCTELIKLIFGYTYDASYTDSWFDYTAILIGSILLQGNTNAVSVLIDSLTHNQQMFNITIGQLLQNANKHIETVLRYPHEVGIYKITAEVKSTLFGCLDMIDDKETRSECAIAFISY